MTSSPELKAALQAIEQLIYVFGGANVIVVALVVWLGGLWQAKEIEKYRHQLGATLALVTARAGALSEVQLEATRAIWSKLFRVQWEAINQVSPLRTIQIRQGMSPEEIEDEYRKQTQAALGNLSKLQVELLTEVNQGRPFLPKALFELMLGYCVKLLSLVQLLDEARLDEDATGVSDRAEWVRRRRLARESREELARQLHGDHDKIADEIRALTTPASLDALRT